jgi:carboxyl-terminal processing protease
LVFLSACAPRWTGSVGAVFGKDNHDGRVYVREAPSNMGAAKAGVQAGDEVLRIDGQDASKLTPEEIHRALTGPVGSKVELSVRRDGRALEFDVERGPLRGE